MAAEYVYGVRREEMGVPTDGLKDICEDKSEIFYWLAVYGRRLSAAECAESDLQYIGKV